MTPLIAFITGLLIGACVGGAGMFFYARELRQAYCDRGDSLVDARKDLEALRDRWAEDRRADSAGEAV